MIRGETIYVKSRSPKDVVFTAIRSLAPHNQERHISHKMLSSTSYDGSGLWICAKKLDGGRFRWPESDSTIKKIVLSHEELTLLLGGIDLDQTRRRRWYRKANVDGPTQLRITS